MPEKVRRAENQHQHRAGTAPAAAYVVIATVAEILADPHFRERGTLRPMRNAAVAGEIVAGAGDGDVAEVVAGFPVLFDGRALPDVAGAPALGQHNAAVLGELCGVDGGELERLRADGVV